MHLATIDWIIITAYFAATVTVGLWASKKAGTDSSEFFLGGRTMPWWLLGISMVATTFSTDTPNLVTDIVRQNGVAGNWVWWAFLLTGMTTVFLFAGIWRRSGVLTDVEFYELRYSGKSAAFLRGFRAVYLGVFFNVLIIAALALSCMKIGGVMLGLSPLQSVFWASLATVIFSSAGGFRGVLLTDLMLFVLAMIGSTAAAYFAVTHVEVGSLRELLQQPAVAEKLSFFPPIERTASGGLTDASLNLWITVIAMPLLVQWWSVWYPGSEPGGGGFIAQRMLAAKDERHAKLAVMFFNFAHYGMRPWPWILVALSSLVVFPTVESIQAAFPHLEAGIIGHDLAYSAMLTFLPTGWLGLVVASLLAAYMSTVSSLLNWGSSYISNDFYRRFLRPEATEKELVRVGRVSTVVLMALGCVLALQLRSALDTFQILLQVGAGTGLLFMLRWFWWRINVYSELSAMIASFVIAVLFKTIRPGWPWWQELVASVVLTTVVWIVVTYFTPPTDRETLAKFYAKIRPSRLGWKPFVQAGAGREISPLLPQILDASLGTVAVLATLFGIGKIIYGEYLFGGILLVVAAALMPRLLRRSESEAQNPNAID